MKTKVVSIFVWFFLPCSSIERLNKLPLAQSTLYLLKNKLSHRRARKRTQDDFKSQTMSFISMSSKNSDTE